MFWHPFSTQRETPYRQDKYRKFFPNSKGKNYKNKNFACHGITTYMTPNKVFRNNVSVQGKWEEESSSKSKYMAVAFFWICWRKQLLSKRVNEVFPLWSLNFEQFQRDLEFALFSYKGKEIWVQLTQCKAEWDKSKEDTERSLSQKDGSKRERRTLKIFPQPHELFSE